MATAKPASATASPLPDGFVSPFTRVEMAPNARIDDGLCCVAMLVNQPLDKIKKLAYQLGLAEHGPAWVYPDLLRKLLHQFDLVASDDKEVPSVDALPDVALITAQYSPETQFGRWVLWHHVRGAGESPSFHYVIDPAYWIDPKHHITNDFKALVTPKQPIYYIEIAPKPSPKGKGK